MTVSSSLNRKAYTGDGVTTSFSTSPVVFYDSDELDVYVVTTATGASTTLTENTHYTVSGGAGSTGSVSLAGGSSPYGAPSASQTLVVVRTLDLVQEFDPQNNDGSDAGNIETAFDKLTMMAQQNAASVARAFKLADSDVSGASTTLPTPSASKLIGWDSAGTALANYASASIVDTIVPTAFMETLLDDANAATARATLDAQQDVFTTRGDLVRAGASGVAERVALGTNGQLLTSNGTDAVWGTDVAASETVAGNVELATQAEVNAMTDTARVLTPNHNKLILGTEVTAGTAATFSVPSGVRRITISFRGVSTNGTSKLIVQLGDAGGFEVTGYLGGTAIVGSATATNHDTGFLVDDFANAAAVRHGQCVLCLEDSTDFAWTFVTNIGRSDTTVFAAGAGSYALSAELTQVRVTAVNGTDAFDAGAINILYER